MELVSRDDASAAASETALGELVDEDVDVEPLPVRRGVLDGFRLLEACSVEFPDEATQVVLSGRG